MISFNERTTVTVIPRFLECKAFKKCGTHIDNNTATKWYPYCISCKRKMWREAKQQQRKLNR